MGNKSLKEIHTDLRDEDGLRTIIQRCLRYYAEIIAFLQLQEYMTNLAYTLDNRPIQLSGTHTRPAVTQYVLLSPL